MKQHNQLEGRKCWQTKRERDRLKARFQIRERVANQSSQSYVPGDFDSDLITQFLGSILKGDRSKFSLTLIDRHFSTLSARIPINFINEKLQHALQLCHAWFGKDYADTLQQYISSLDTFTVMEFSIWTGKYTIAGCLLVGGVNPCVRGYPSNEEGVDTEWELRIGSQVLRRFFDCFPLPLSGYIVKRIVDLRMANNNSTAACCMICKSADVPKSLRLTINCTCKHTVCEPCVWKDVLEHIDEYGEMHDIFICPVCKSVDANVQPTHQLPQLEEVKSLSPLDRAAYSLNQLSLLPINRHALKNSDRKKKKTKEEESIASSWYWAVKPSLGLSQEVRRDKFFNYVDRNALHYVRGCLVSGVDVNWTNEYGQTALYISVWRGFLRVAKLLLEFGANPCIAANGGSTVKSICHARQYQEIIEIIQVCRSVSAEEGTMSMQSRLEGLQFLGAVDKSLSVLIPTTVDHPGAGSYFIDGVLSRPQAERLLSLHQHLPIDTTQKKKNSLCSERSYYCDSDGSLCDMLEDAIYRVGLASREESPCKVFRHMRFLNYSNPGGFLAPHVDLCRVDPFSDKRSTHTLILYLTTCREGGETSLLAKTSGESEVLASISVVCGRMLLFPHPTPHRGDEVVDVPKILLRGELALEG